MKLYQVICRGMRDSHGMAYVVASDAETAYRRVRDDLNKRDLGYDKDREMQTVTLVAEEAEYPACSRLYLAEGSTP